MDMVLIGIAIVAVFVVGLVFGEGLIASVSILMRVLAHGWRNNTMMAYVERYVYDTPKERWFRRNAAGYYDLPLFCCYTTILLKSQDLSDKIKIKKLCDG